ncbi:hypothetical protein BRM47_06330, partial [Xanthomonas oryzae pv. oryzae]
MTDACVSVCPPLCTTHRRDRLGWCEGRTRPGRSVKPSAGANRVGIMPADAGVLMTVVPDAPVTPAALSAFL